MPQSEHSRAAEVVATFHEQQLCALLNRVEDALERFRAGEIDAFEADRELFQYSRAAKELWKFCSFANVVDTAQLIEKGPPEDWWDRGTFRRR